MYSGMYLQNLEVEKTGWMVTAFLFKKPVTTGEGIRLSQLSQPFPNSLYIYIYEIYLYWVRKFKRKLLFTQRYFMPTLKYAAF